MSISYKNTDISTKSSCFACGVCGQACPHNAISFCEDAEGFAYPHVRTDLCTECGICEKLCPHDNPPERNDDEPTVFSGYLRDNKILEESTSGGAFSAIVDLWCKENYVIFGAESDGLAVRHSFVMDKRDIAKFRKSKYSQSMMGDSYKRAKLFLKEGKNVLFSGTPCQISGLRNYLHDKEYQGKLLTIEVICEGVPSPLFIKKYIKYLEKKYHKDLKEIDYRYKDGKRWDYQAMRICFPASALTRDDNIVVDRYFNPFWSIWLQHLMNRPSCYSCPFATNKRTADITLGDFWGVNEVAPDLYGNNRGCSIVICNSERARELGKNLNELMFGHIVDFHEAIRFQSPMNAPIPTPPKRQEFMNDLVKMDYIDLCKKWDMRTSRKFLMKHYLLGHGREITFKNIIILLSGLLRIKQHVLFRPYN